VRYEFLETRNAAGVLKTAVPEAYAQVMDVLAEFELIDDDLLLPGGEESGLAKRMNRAFRVRGWREAQIDARTMSHLRVLPLADSDEPDLRVVELITEGTSHRVDNYRDRVALQVVDSGDVDTALVAMADLYDAEYVEGGIIVLGHCSDPCRVRYQFAASEDMGCPILAVANRQHYQRR